MLSLNGEGSSSGSDLFVAASVGITSGPTTVGFSGGTLTVSNGTQSAAFAPAAGL